MFDLSSFRDLWRSLGSRGQLTIIGALVGVVFTGYLLFNYASKPSYTTLRSGLSGTEAGDVTSALEGAGIAYKLGSGGTQVEVRDGQVAAANVALAQKGVTSGGHEGWGVLDQQGLAVTDFQQKVGYQRALEGNIATAIEKIDGVTSADVQLVMPDDTLFTSEGEKASASVLLGAANLDATAVKGIAHLVSSAVKGLSADRVTITSSEGMLLWPSSTDAGSMNAAATLAAEQQYGDQLSNRINALLAATLGPNKAQARVHADLQLDQTEVEQITYGKKGVPLTSSSTEETLGSTGGAATAGAAGVTSNVPSYSGTQTGGSSKSNYSNKSGQTTWGVNKKIERTTLAPGEVKKLDVALLVSDAVPQTQVAALRSAVAGVAGIDTKRGDTLNVSRVQFAAPAAAAKKAGPLAAIMANPLALAKDVGIGLLALVVLLLAMRSLKRRESDGFAPEPTWLHEIEAAWPLRELEGAPTLHLELEPGAQKRETVTGELRELAMNQPKQVAQQVGQWMRE